MSFPSIRADADEKNFTDQCELLWKFEIKLRSDGCESLRSVMLYYYIPSTPSNVMARKLQKDFKTREAAVFSDKYIIECESLAN